MFDQIFSLYGSDNPSNMMEKFYNVGNETLITLRNIVASPGKEKKPRTWNSIEATELVGVSHPTFRKLLEKYENVPGVVEEKNKKGAVVKKYTLQAINFLREKASTKYKRPANSTPLVIAVSNLKGGVGKTATAVDFCKKVAIEGLRVLLLDFDAQGTATLISSGKVPDFELSYDETITNTLIYDPNKISEIVLKTHFDGFDIIPANLGIQDCDLILSNPESNNEKLLGHGATRLRNALQSIKNNYDIIVIDCPPNVGMLTLNAIIACDGIIFPIPPNMSDYSSFIMYMGILRNLLSNLSRKKFLYLRILLSKHTGSNEALQMENMIREQFGRYVLKNHMCETVEVAKASSEIGSIYDASKPRGSRETYRRAIDHLNDVNLEIINNFKDIWERQSMAFVAHQETNTEKQLEVE